MPTPKNIDNNLTKSSATANFKIRNLLIVFIGVISALVLIISILILLDFKHAQRNTAQETIDDQIYKLSKKAKAGSSNFNFNERKSSLSQNTDEETGLPVINQEELAKKYQEDLRKIMADIEQQIQMFGEQKIIDVETIKVIKKRAIEEVVPKKYQNLHVDLIFALDLMIDSDMDGAMDKLELVKNNI